MKSESQLRAVVLVFCAVIVTVAAVVEIKRINDGERSQALLAATLGDGR